MRSRMSGERTGLSDEQFAAIWEECGGSPAEVSRHLGIALQNVYSRRNALKGRGLHLETFSLNPAYNPALHAYTPVLTHAVHEGVIVIGSDLHAYHPDLSGGVMVRAMANVIGELQPRIVVLNGDVLDMKAAGRHGSEGAEYVPTMDEEIQHAEIDLEMFERAAPNAARYWTVGNHDKRFDRYFAARAPEARRMHGLRIADHFPRWRQCTRLEINKFVVKHFMFGGLNARRINVQKSGRSNATAHLHRLGVTPVSNYDLTLYGCETGMLADPIMAERFKHLAPQFDYVDGNPVDWQQGFLVLTFAGGVLLEPEVCSMIGGKPVFRGKVVA